MNYNKNYILFAFVFVALLILSIIFVFGVSDKSFNEVNAGKKISNEVYEKAEKGGNVRVFVKFEEEAGSVKGIARANEQRKAIKETIGKSKIKHDFGNTISAFLNENDLKRLEGDDRIESIRLVGIKHILLQDSVPIINGTKTWQLQQNALNLTGAGQTVCIIDTGVNYSHSDLGGCYGNNNASSSCKVLGGIDYVNNDTDPMDDEGHGTHVTGIVAANGSINGVAPKAKIIAIKACDSGGGCWDDDVTDGINWCVNNATIFNISVISMSLGADLYSSYCDNQPNATGYVGPINSAMAKNISVVIASGNGLNNVGPGRNDQIATPACVQNATPISSVDKSDNIATDYADRNLLVLLMAPGGVSTNSATLINSTCVDGGYCGKQGTSMAAPHVAGAIAIMRQYLQLTSQTKTPKQIELALNSTGKRINDTSTGIWYSRINLYSAIISLDINAPNITLISPSNNSILQNSSQTFRCNATDLSLKNVTFYLWNSSSVYNQTFQSVSGAANRFEINISNIANGNYSWNCFYTDENNNRVFANANYSLIITSIAVNLISPANNLFTNQNQTFSCNASTSGNALANATFYIWNSSELRYNSSTNVSGLSNGTTFNYNFSYESNYKWNCLFVNNASSQSFASANYSITYDFTPPSLNITSPSNNSYYSSGRFNVSLTENGSCLYSLDFGLNNISMSSADNKNFSATNSSLSQGNNYNLTFYCNDSAGNRNSSSIINFNIDLILPNVALVEPFPSDETASSSSKLFYYNVSDNLNVSSCSLILNEAVNLTNSSIINQSANHSFTQTLSSGAYTWGINCTDIAGNAGNSSLRSFTITAPSIPSQSSSSGGGGGGGALSASKMYSVEEVQLQKGYSNELSKGEKIKFTMLSENHTLTLNFTNSSAASIIIASKPINIVLSIGQSMKLSIVSTDYYDLLVKLEGISNEKANITLKMINESVALDVVKDKLQNQSKLPSGIMDERKNNDRENLSNNDGYFRYFVYAFILLLILSIIFVVYKKGRKNKEKGMRRTKGMKKTK